MLFVLKKALTYCVMPLPFCLELIAVGALLVWLAPRLRRSGRGLIVVGIVLLLAFSNKKVGIALLRPLEATFPAVPDLAAGQPLPDSLKSCRAIVILGSGHADLPALAATDKLSPAGLSRLVEGVRLSRLLPGVPVVVSGPSDGRGATHASVLATAAVSLGVDPGRIVQIDTARDTGDEAAAVRQLLGAGATFALVSSASHLPRAVGLMRHAGLDPVACPTQFLARANAGAIANDWLFSLSALEMSTWAVYERLGIAWARLTGQI